MFLSSALVTFVSLWLLIRHIKPRTMRRLVGRLGLFDLVLHATIIILFHGTFTGLMQAECAGIMISLYLRGYRWAFGYERRGQRIPGRFTRIAQ